MNQSRICEIGLHHQPDLSLMAEASNSHLTRNSSSNPYLVRDTSQIRLYELM